MANAGPTCTLKRCILAHTVLISQYTGQQTLHTDQIQLVHQGLTMLALVKPYNYDTISVSSGLRMNAQLAVLPPACICCNFRVGLRQHPVGLAVKQTRHGAVMAWILLAVIPNPSRQSIASSAGRNTHDKLYCGTARCS